MLLCHTYMHVQCTYERMYVTMHMHIILCTNIYICICAYTYMIMELYFYVHCMCVHYTGMRSLVLIYHTMQLW